MQLQWITCRGNELQANTLYEILQLRCQVFVVEQNCVYQDIDGIDLNPTVLHLTGYSQDRNCLLAYLRVIEYNPGQIRIGRVVIQPGYRQHGLGRALMKKALDICYKMYENQLQIIVVMAQAHLEQFYGSFGFERKGSNFMEDGIPHVEMHLLINKHDCST